MKRTLILILLLFVIGCTQGNRKKEHNEEKDRIFPVKGAFIYDFKGYLTRVGDYAVDRRAIENCGSYSTSCIRKGELWFCICHDRIQYHDEVIIGIEDKTNR